MPLSELNVLNQTVPSRKLQGTGHDSTADLAMKTHQNGNDNLQTPGNIIFVRRRMLYARAALKTNGEVRLGLKHIRTLKATL